MRTIAEIQLKLLELQEKLNVYMDYLRNLPPGEDRFEVVNTINLISHRIESIEWVLKVKAEFNDVLMYPMD